MSRWSIPAGLTWLFVQCDQMAFIVFIIGTLTTMKNCPIVYKIYQSLEQFLPNTKQTLIKLPMTFSLCKSGEISPNLVSLDLCPHLLGYLA